ncbi:MULTISPECIES: hypothetical protein [Calothrix]|uniref:Uncharacterized protein n=2 Tax=Calothrix TaxID=1186 RepID=A0ABR8AAF0_9CYAN|nr:MULTISPECIES: hypothetical protein [Calothrix]MBD2196986.1 hypothetical protein [Calothrix parietina FACHB-288]MBD2225538.1 hypothetical protein [Calothrix anomala FACHB-343]
MYVSLAVQAQVHPHKRNDVGTNPLTGSMIILLPLMFLLTITTYRKSKARTLRRRIADLERMWRLNSPKQTP